jgi:hypothetical protein
VDVTIPAISTRSGATWPVMRALMILMGKINWTSRGGRNGVPCVNIEGAEFFRGARSASAG